MNHDIKQQANLIEYRRARKRNPKWGNPMNQNNFSIGGELIRRVSTVTTKLFAINLLTALCCIPVITAGAALTAMHDCALKVARKEDVAVFHRFFQVFRDNFKQATLLWLPFLMIFSAALADLFVLLAAPEVLPAWIAVAAISAALVAFMIFQYVLPLQAHFVNSVSGILRSACILSVSCFPRTVAMALVWAVPVYCFLKLTVTWPLVLMFGLALPAFVCAKLYGSVFTALEENSRE